MSGVYSKVNGKSNISQVNSKYNNNWRDTYQIYKKDDSSWEKYITIGTNIVIGLIVVLVVVVVLKPEQPHVEEVMV